MYKDFPIPVIKLLHHRGCAMWTSPIMKKNWTDFENLWLFFEDRRSQLVDEHPTVKCSIHCGSLRH